MYDTSDFKKGVFIEIDNIPYRIVDFQHVKPGKGNAFVRTRLKNMISNAVLDRTFKSGEQFPAPDIEQKQMQFLYGDNNGFNFTIFNPFCEFGSARLRVPSMAKSNVRASVARKRSAPRVARVSSSLRRDPSKRFLA